MVDLEHSLHDMKVKRGANVGSNPHLTEVGIKTKLWKRQCQKKNNYENHSKKKKESKTSNKGERPVIKMKARSKGLKK